MSIDMDSRGLDPRLTAILRSASHAGVAGKVPPIKVSYAKLLDIARKR